MSRDKLRVLDHFRFRFDKNPEGRKINNLIWVHTGFGPKGIVVFRGLFTTFLWCFVAFCGVLRAFCGVLWTFSAKINENIHVLSMVLSMFFLH